MTALGRERLLASASALPDAAAAGRARALMDTPLWRDCVGSILANSPYLTAAAEREMAFFLDLLELGADRARSTAMTEVGCVVRQAAVGTDPGPALRRLKRRLALVTAVADIAGLWDVDGVMATLSDFADGALAAAAAWLLADAHRRGEVVVADSQDPQQRSGLIILGVGKLGARELNYSSDIDLIVFYDPDVIRTDEPDALHQRMVRLTRRLIRLMAERTSEGYVFRTDLRLRPDPGATAPAMTVLAAETYYETLGQNWERAALIKARPVAGDIAAGWQFLAAIAPFIWRKHLDFAAIQDIHSIKRQIHAHRGGATIAVAGHNIKLGRGGIREIEFFVQTQQLIWGGRMAALRVSATQAGLTALAAAGKIADHAAEDLRGAYRFLRRVEHRLQMINDEQTHTLPVDPQRLAHLASFLGFGTSAAFAEELIGHLRRVESHYADLFEDAPVLHLRGRINGNLVFTGSEADPETLETLARLGFSHGDVVDQAVRSWHHGRCRAMRSQRARELLTELMPAILSTFAGKPDPDAGLIAFDRFLQGLPAGVQLFAMFHAKPELLDLLAEVLGIAPTLAEHLARKPQLLESVLTRGFFDPPPGRDTLISDFLAALGDARDDEDLLEIARRWAAERQFQLGVQSLRGMLPVDQAASGLSDVAEAVLAGLLPWVRGRFAQVHGGIGGDGMVVVALGKLGAREMTATSDLDLMFIYDSPDGAAQSDGQRPLPVAAYYARLCQRLINALTAATGEGRLYEVDMRLRPSGKAGPLATSLPSFITYQRQSAWTWEHMALTRARVVAGSPALAGTVSGVIRHVLTLARDATVIARDVAHMRDRIAREHPGLSVWDAKHHRGGLVDIEFIVQFLQLRDACRHPEVLATGTAAAVQALAAAGSLSREASDELSRALVLWQAVQSRQRLARVDLPSHRDDAEPPPTFRKAMNGVADLEFTSLLATLEVEAACVRRRFDEIVVAAVVGAAAP